MLFNAPNALNVLGCIVLTIKIEFLQFSPILFQNILQVKYFEHFKSFLLDF